MNPSSRKRGDPAWFAERGMAALAKLHKLAKPLVTSVAHATRPDTKETLVRVSVVEQGHANDAVHHIVLDAEGEPVAASKAIVALFAPAARTIVRPKALAPAPITIAPTTNDLTLGLGDTFDEVITVTVPRNGAVPKADVYFLADTTGSMEKILSAVQAGANGILSALTGLGIDIAFGVGNYRDFPSSTNAFQHQLSPSASASTVSTAIGAWFALAGGDRPEGQLFALESLAQTPGGTIGWRAGAKRIVVWFGDAPGHDPVCAAISGAASTVTEASATAKLVSEGIVVLAISTDIPGLDDDPTVDATNYVPTCGAPGGTPGQATRLANATGGQFVTGIDASTIVNTIISLVGKAVGVLSNVRLVPSADIADFVDSIDPATGYGPLKSDEQHELPFRVRFSGKRPCRPEAQVISGTIDVLVDKAVVTAKQVRITIPACKPRGFVYSVKYTCGVQCSEGCACTPLRPGSYATAIAIHNPAGTEVKVAKRVIPLVLAGAVAGREPRTMGPRASDSIVLPPHAATLDDCCRISELLLGAPEGHGLQVGILEITSDSELAVSALYSSTSPDGSSLSLDVVPVPARRI